MMTRVVFNAEPAGFSPAARDLWQQAGEYYEGDLDDPRHADLLVRVTVLIVRLARRIDQRVLDRCPCLKTLVSATTGLDHLDLDLLAKRRIELICLRGETEFLATIPSTAEHAFGMMLALLRNIVPASESVRDGKWQRDRFRGRQLRGRRLGLIGLGRTGRMMATYAAGFDMRVGYYDPHVNDSSIRRFDSLDALLQDSEIVSLHVHLTAHTRAMIGVAELQRMPRGGWLINTSRGGLLDEHALVEHIGAGHVTGAAVDVLDGEIDGITASPLWQAMRDGKNVLITPHLGGATLDAMQQCEDFIASKFMASRAEARGDGRDDR